MKQTEGIIFEFKESEGLTLILLKSIAEEFHVKFEYICSWITLKVHSSLQAVGLTAEFSKVLTKNSISCNVVAGFYHDHIFVDVNDAEKAIEVLKTLSTN